MQNNELTPKQQVIELVRQAQSVLIVTGREPSVDQVFSVYAFQTILAKLGKKSHAVITDQLPSASKLVDTSKISRSLDGVRDFIVSLDLARVEVDKLKYDIRDGRLDITITPHAGNFEPTDARFEYGSFQFDLVIVLGVHKINRIDRLLEANPTLFDGLHLINIDYHRVNEGYGSVNYVDFNATSVSEMLISIFESLSQGMIDADIATALLAGIMTTTNRFTTANTSPKALTMAAQLMSGGARQQEIVKNLFTDKLPDVRPRLNQPTSQPQTQPRVNQPVKESAAESKTIASVISPEALQQLKAAAELMQAPVQAEPIAALESPSEPAQTSPAPAHYLEQSAPIAPVDEQQQVQ